MGRDTQTVLAGLCVVVLALGCSCVAGSEEALSGKVVDGPVIGIDLGTTYSVVGVWQHGHVEIIANEMGNRITPSVVAFTDTERLIGDGAKNQISENPANSIYAVKRLMGRKFSDPVVQQDQALLSYNISAGADGGAVVSVVHKGVGRNYTAEEVSAMILGRMKETAERYLGEAVHHAVVTVPAYFNDAQRQATKDAGTIAGLNVLRIINEPTAAALAYGLDKKAAGEEEKNVLVFDLGGGTFDVSVLQIESGFFEVLATHGNTHLGGEDFDNRMVAHFAKTIKHKYGRDVLQSPRALARLRAACESAKRQLSAAPEARVEVEGLFEGVDFSERMGRAKFEELNNDLFKGTLQPVRAVLADADLRKADIDEIVLVGGSTRIPKIRALIRDFFGKEPNTGVNADESVAYGAAVQGAVLSGVSEVADKVLLVDVIPLSVGIETVGGVMTKVLDRNTAVPAERSQTFSTHTDNQRGVNVKVFEGERAMAKDCRLLGSFELSGIAPAARGVPQIAVSFNVDRNGILLVSAEDKANSQRESLTISSDHARLDKDEIARMVEEAAGHAEVDKLVRERVEARNQLEGTAYSLKAQVGDDDKLGAKIDADERAAIEAAVEAALGWLDENPAAEQDELAEQLQQLQSVSNPIIEKVYQNSGGSSSSVPEDEDEDGEEEEDL